MSENKCPCCGAIIMVLVKGTAECFKCPFVCAIKDFPSIAAAMEAEARHNELKEAVCKVVEMHRKGEGHVCTHYPSGRRALDTLAALVGEEGK